MFENQATRSNFTMNAVEQSQQTFNYAKLLEEYNAIANVIPFETPRSSVVRHRTIPVFKNTLLDHTLTLAPYTSEVCNEISKKLLIRFNYAAFRLMPPRSTIGLHRDVYVSENYHIPVETNEGCFFVSNNHLYDMQNVGYLYRVDSSRLHTFINAGDTNRVHLQFVYDLNGHLLSGEYS